MNRLLPFLLALLLLLAPVSLSAADSDDTPSLLARVNGAIASVLFVDVAGGAITIPEVDINGAPVMNEATGVQNEKTIEIPFLIAILAFGAIFFTFFYGWINVRGFGHAINVVRGKYDKDDDHGEISHFKALTSALSATVGLGNIAGVAVAIQAGGPGAVPWMMLLAIFGMSAKFGSCTLGQMYRRVNSDGSISGGPMYYLDIGLAEVSPLLKPFGKILAVMFAVMVMGGAIGGGNMFQANQTVEAFTHTFKLGGGSAHLLGIIMAFCVGIVILGGIKRIGEATSKIVPLMCALYVLASLFVLFANYSAIPDAITTMFTMAFSDNAFFGGIIGVMVMGFRRAAFSNEAGLGSAAIAHAAAKTEEPVREGLVAMLGPIIDTVIICLMTSLVIIVTGVWSDPSIGVGAQNVGVTLTSEAFASVLPWFPYVLTICIALFAYSTMISWCYYGERGWIYLLDHLGEGTGLKTLAVFRILFVGGTYFGAISALKEVIDFTDLMILSMALPNIVGSIFLAPKAKALLDDYWKRYKDGAFE